MERLDDGTYRYSHQPQEAYTRNGQGHGVWVSDLASWNLLWLTFPELDLYLNPEKTRQELWDIVPHTLAGQVAAVASTAMETEYPGLRRALHGHLKGLNGYLHYLSVTIANQNMQTPWELIVRDRVADLLTVDAVQEETPRQVIFADFKRRRITKVIEVA